MSKRLGLVIDQERCIGCEACTVACKIENNSIGHRIQVETQNVPQKDTPSGQYPDVKLEWLLRLCNHCANPPCVDACPNDALIKREDGPVIYEEKKCDGCQACVNACPYNVILYIQEKNIIEKCNLCVHRIDKGLEPFCVICCEGQAIFFGDLNDPNSLVSQKIGSREVFQLKPEVGTSPSVYYCPPKPRRRL
ncbi:MAG: 4Fe-4S dicluster domain-containing protein [Promethearchaeota archaeon]